MINVFSINLSDLWTRSTGWLQKVLVPNDILFIDDNIEKFEIPGLLKNHGYTVHTLTDIKSIDCTEVKKSRVIFVDYKGVGREFGDQGIGVIKSIKKRYKGWKKVILYSSYSFKLSKDIDAADEKIDKNAPLEDFIALVEKYI